MRRRIYRSCAMVLIPLMMLLNCPVGPVVSSALAEEIDVEIKHTPVTEVDAGERVALEAEISDPSGIKEVRVYFKSVEAEAYSFVPMSTKDGEQYTGQLPAPANGAGSFDYLLLAQTNSNKVFKSQTYTVTIEDDDDAQSAVAKNEQIKVYTELEQAPVEISGFSDNIVINVVESAAKLGVVAGIYSAATTGTSTSGAVAAGTVTASTGISTTAIVIGAVAAAAAVAGVAAVASSSSDGDGDASSGVANRLTSTSILGTWNVRENGNSFSLTFNSNKNWSETGGNRGTWNLSGNTLSMADVKGQSWSGTVSGNSNNFTMTGPSTAVFTR